MSYTELIRAIMHTSAVNWIKTVAAADLITRFYLPRIYGMKNKQNLQDIPITKLDEPEDDISLLTTYTMRNIMRCVTLKHTQRAARNISEFVRDSPFDAPESIAPIQPAETALTDIEMEIDQ